MENNILTAPAPETAVIITPDVFLKHWQGHRRITRRLIEKFPADQLFTYSIGGMRTFGEMVIELLGIASPGVSGMITGEWKNINQLLHHTGLTTPTNKEELLQLWDVVTVQLEDLFPQIPLEDYQKVIKAFNMYEGTIVSMILYFIDNEIHHRGQGYVYLRALGIEPPYFYDRS